MIYYDDPEKQAKLDDAIKHGLIIRKKDSDGVYVYELTQKGIFQWRAERFMA